MGKIDLEKFICSLGRQCYCSLFNAITFRDIQRALADQGLEYRDGAIVEIESQELKKVEQEEMTEFERAIHRRLNLLNGEIFDLEGETEGMVNELLDIAKRQLPPEEYNRGYKQAIDDAVEYMDRIWDLNIMGNSINDFRHTMEKNLKEK